MALTEEVRGNCE